MMRQLPFTDHMLHEVIRAYQTPFHLYDEAGIRATCHELYNAFAWADFTNFFAVKALPNPSILEIVRSEGMGVDCSSFVELVQAERCGFKGEQIMFTSNDTAEQEFKKAYELGAIMNLDDILHIESLEKAVGRLPKLLCFRYNPGAERVGNEIIGNPVEAKYGLTRDQIFEAYSIAKKKGVQRFGLHTMLASNELDPTYFVETATMLFELAKEVREKLEIEMEFLNLGGGFGIPYHPEQQPLDSKTISTEVELLYKHYFSGAVIQPKLFMECGRYITGPHGYLVSTVAHMKHTYRDYVGLDASMANLMRPGMYGAYHHISVLGKTDNPADHIYDVTGSLCENNDKFAIQRPLPKIEVGDIVIIYDTGAHGHSMGFNYNGKLRSAELLLTHEKDVRLIRRAETIDDYFATTMLGT